jgi:uncharacterized damage-inducible protein DinB
LESTGQAIQQALDIWTVADLDHTVEWRYGDELYTYTRQQMIWNLVRHDYHHYGELALAQERAESRLVSEPVVRRRFTS